MELVRSWLRWTSTALGASLLVPGAVVIVAAGVALGGGGIGGLGALGQLVEGPRDPLAAIGGLEPADDTLGADPSALIAAVPAGTSPPGGDAGGGGDIAAPDTGTPGDGGGGEDRGGGDGGGDNPGGGTPGGGDGDGGGGTPDRPPAPGDPPPGPLAPVQEGTEPVVEQLPEPVGPLSGDLIDEMVELGEQVLGSPGGRGLLGGVNRSP